jgi:hypothetical protein
MFATPAQDLFFPAAADELAPAGTVVRGADGTVRAFQHAGRRLAIVRCVADHSCLVVFADGAVDLAAALPAFAAALWPGPTPRDEIGDLLGCYRLSADDELLVGPAGAGLEVRAVGQDACARLAYGMPRHPEWPDLLDQLESHAELHLRPLLRRDRSSLTRVFAPGTPPSTIDGAVALIAGLVAEHGAPGKPQILGSRTFGVNATWIRVPFGKTAVVVRVVWHAYQWREVARDDCEHPVALAFRGDGRRFVATSLDGKHELSLEFDRRSNGPAPSLRLRDASREGRAGVVARRKP